jgi:hypothetical protein
MVEIGGIPWSQTTLITQVTIPINIELFFLEPDFVLGGDFSLFTVLRLDGLDHFLTLFWDTSFGF